MAAREKEKLLQQRYYQVDAYSYYLYGLLAATIFLALGLIGFGIGYGVWAAQIRDELRSFEAPFSDPFIGTWVGHASNMSQWIQFHNFADGLLEFHSSLDLGVPFHGFEFGAFLTSGQGYWKSLGNNEYMTLQTQVIVAKDTTPGNFLAGIPAMRIVVNSTALMSPDGAIINGAYTIFGYTIPDVEYQFPMHLTDDTYTVFKLMPTLAK